MEQLSSMTSKQKKAYELHKNGYNCTQAVACAFCEDFGIDRETMFKIAEGFGFGMGMQEVCGALSGAFMILGMENSIGDPEKGKITKAETYKKVREIAKQFQEKNGSVYCRELKSKENGHQLVSCDTCVVDAAGLIEEYLLTNKITKIISDMM